MNKANIQEHFEIIVKREAQLMEEPPSDDNKEELRIIHSVREHLMCADIELEYGKPVAPIRSAEITRLMRKLHLA